LKGKKLKDKNKKEDRKDDDIGQKIGHD